MTEAECIDCGQWSEALLPARFPHICSACLFSPPPKEESNGEPSAEVREQFKPQTLYERIHALRSNGTFHGGADTFGHGIVEKRDQQQHGDRSWN